MSLENDLEPRDRLPVLESDELTIGVTLSATNYAELLLLYLIQQRLNQAKFCYMRAIEKFDRDQLLRQIWTVGEHACKRNFALALKHCGVDTTGLNPTIQAYIAELKNRLLASQLSLIAKCYSSVSVPKFSELIGLNEASPTVQDILQRCGWPVQNDGFIVPAKNAQLEQTVAVLHDPRFGPVVEVSEKSQEANELLRPDIERSLKDLESLVNYSIFFDAMGVPAGEGGGGNSGNGNNPANN